MHESYPTDTEPHYIEPSPDDAVPLIASGATQYMRQAKNVQEHHTGSKEAYLTDAEEALLAEQIQAGNVAATSLLDIGESTNEADIWYKAQLKYDVQTGINARNKLVETNLRFAAYFARMSMNLSPKSLGDEDDEPDFRLKRRTGKRLGTIGDVRKLASRYAVLDDRIQVANMALIKAAAKFRPFAKDGKQISFLTFAAWDIHADLYKYAVESEFPTVKFTTHIGSDMRKMIDEAGEPSDKERETLAYRLLRDGVPLETFQTGIDAPEEYDGEDEPPQLLTVEELIVNTNEQSVTKDAEQMLLAGQLEHIFETLTDRESGIIRHRFGLVDGEPKTLDEIGMVYGITRTRVAQIELKAMSRLRHPSRSQYLRDYLEPNTDMSPENYMWGSRGAAQRPYLASLLVRLETEPNMFTGSNYTAIPQAETSKDWRLTADEDWDTPVRKTPSELADAFWEAGVIFHRLLSTEETQFLRQETVGASLLNYPYELTAQVMEECGNFLRPYHIEAFWNDHIESYLTRIRERHGDALDLTRISLFFSRLLAERMTDNDSVTLYIPASLDGALNYFGNELAHGELTVRGNLGNHAGNRIQSLANLTVEGSVADYAAAEASGLAVMTVTGNAGQLFAYGAKNGTFRVNGRIDALALMRNFAGEVFAGSVGQYASGSVAPQVITGKS